MDRKIAKVVHKYTLGEEPKELVYWLTRPMHERFLAVEFLRYQFTENGTDKRLERVCNITQFS